MKQRISFLLLAVAICAAGVTAHAATLHQFDEQDPVTSQVNPSGRTSPQKA